MTADLLILARMGTDGAAQEDGAVAVTDGRITALGDAARAATSTATEVLDLGDAVVRPGFGDGHIHPLWGGIELAWAPIRDCMSVEEIVEAVRLHAAANPDDTWVLGGSYDPALAPHGLFDARWLDAAVPDRPVMLEASDHHCAWLNTAALRVCGITAETADPPASRIARRPDGSPMGTLVEWEAVDLVKAHVPQPDEAARRAGLRASTRLLAAAGVTWAQEAAATVADVATYLGAAADGDLAVRANLALRAEPGLWLGQLEEFAAARASTSGSTQVSARTIKFFADGIIEAGSAALLEPYADAPDTCGLPVWETAELAEAVAAFDAYGFQAHIHAIGDAGVRAALDAFAHTERRNGARDRRPVIAHTQLVDPSDLARFASLGVVANFEPLWMCLEPGMTELTLPRLGDRSSVHYPTGALSRSGAHLSFGSDWPVSSMRPLEGLAVAVTRQTAAGEPPSGWTPEERLTPAEALAAYTSGVAYQAFAEDEWGRLDVGQRADLVALSADPMSTHPLEWPEITVLATWLGRSADVRLMRNASVAARVSGVMKRWPILVASCLGVPALAACATQPAHTTAEAGDGFSASHSAAATGAAHSSHPSNTSSGLTGIARLYGGPLLPNGKMGLDGDPGMDITVTVSRGGTVVARMVTGRDGAFAFDLAPGHYVISGCTSFDVVVRAGRTSAHDLTCPVP